MSTPTATPVGTAVPLPHLGEHHHGTVLRRTWCESLGEILHVREATQSGGTTLLIYGEPLAALLAELGTQLTAEAPPALATVA